MGSEQDERIAMKKFMNDPQDFVDEFLDGLVLAYPRHFTRHPADGRVITRAAPATDGHVGIVTGGGSGHLPLFLGYVGDGLLSAAAVGNVFSAQSSDAALTAIRAAHGGAGVLTLFGNYTGDRLNFEVACDLAEVDGIRTATVICHDDVASAPIERAAERRGVAGIAFAFKCAGAAATAGSDLDSVAGVAREVISRTRSMGVGLSPTTIPATGRATFDLADGEMEVGIGIHGEPGARRSALSSADDVTDELLTPLAAELGLGAGDRVALLVNGMGATSPEELFIIARRIHQRLAGLKIDVHRSFVGEFATSMEMAGASISVLHLNERITELLDAPCQSPLVPGSMR